MIMKTIELNLYKFDELSDQAKQTAIEKLSDINVDYDWWQFTYEDAENIGLKITSFDLDRNRHATGEFLEDAYTTACKIMIEHGKECDTYKTAENFVNFWNDAVTAHSDMVECDIVEFGKEYDFDEYVSDAVDEFLKDILEDYSIMLQNESEYLQGEEAIKETIMANDYDFTIDGLIY